MLDVDSFNNILAVVRCCVAANRADLIEPSLVDRLHVGEVRAKIESERAARPAAPASSSASAPARRSIFGGPTSAEDDRLQAAIKQRMQAMHGAKPAG